MTFAGGAISAFTSGTYVVTRTAVGTTTKGIYTAGATSTFSIVASVQPVDGKTLDALPEGERMKETRLVFTETELKARTPAHEPDWIAIGGERYEVFRVKKWEAFGESHYEALISREAQP